MQRKTQHFVQAVARGFKVLQAFREDRPALTLTAIASLTGMNTPTAQRITDTLVELGYLKRNRHKEFFLGPKVLTLGFAYLHGSQLTTLAEQYIDAFFERFSWTVNLSVLEGHEVIYLMRREARRFLKYHVQPGFRLPVNCTAMGKVLAAALPDHEMHKLLAEMEYARLTPHSIVDPKHLRAVLHQVRQQGYAIAQQELSMDVSAAAVPVLDREARVVASVNVALNPEQAQGEYFQEAIARLMELGRELSTSLGYQGEYPVIRAAPALPSRGAAG